MAASMSPASSARRICRLASRAKYEEEEDDDDDDGDDGDVGGGDAAWGRGAPPPASSATSRFSDCANFMTSASRDSQLTGTTESSSMIGRGGIAADFSRPN